MRVRAQMIVIEEWNIEMDADIDGAKMHTQKDNIIHTQTQKMYVKQFVLIIYDVWQARAQCEECSEQIKNYNNMNRLIEIMHSRRTQMDDF